MPLARLETAIDVASDTLRNSNRHDMVDRIDRGLRDVRRELAYRVPLLRLRCLARSDHECSRVLGEERLLELLIRRARHPDGTPLGVIATYPTGQTSI